MDLEFLQKIGKVESNLNGQPALVRNSENNTAYAKSQKFILKHQQMINNIKEILELPKKGEIVNIMSNNQFNAFTFIPFILSQKKIKTLSVVSYSITETVIDSLVDLVRTKQVERLNLFLSQHLIAIRPKISKKIMRIYEKGDLNINLGFARSHAKITIMDNYVISGSGNMNKNAKLEQYFLSNSKEMAAFFLENFFDKFEITEEQRGLLNA